MIAHMDLDSDKPITRLKLPKTSEMQCKSRTNLSCRPESIKQTTLCSIAAHHKPQTARTRLFRYFLLSYLHSPWESSASKTEKSHGHGHGHGHAQRKSSPPAARTHRVKERECQAQQASQPQGPSPSPEPAATPHHRSSFFIFFIF
jgi:hypothetical protein